LQGRSLPGETVIFNTDGTINSIFDNFLNSGQQRARGFDFGVQYQRQTPFGTFTSLTQGTYLDSFVFQATRDSKAAEVSGYATDEISDDGYLKWRWTSRLDWAWNGFDLNTTLRYTSGFHERTNLQSDVEDFGLRFEHYVKSTWMVDGQASYDFTFAAPIESQPVAGYSKYSTEVVRGKDGRAVESAASQAAACGLPIWKQVLNNTTLTLGCDNIFGADPPKAFGFESGGAGFPDFIYDSLGRFVYVSLTKKF
jgi:hypothetical protein